MPAATPAGRIDVASLWPAPCLPRVVCQHEDEGLHPKRGQQEHHTPPGTACTTPTGVEGKGQQAPVCTNSMARVHSGGSDRWHQCGIHGSNENDRGYNVGMAEGEQLQRLCLEQEHHKPCNFWLAGHRCTARRAEEDKHKTVFGIENGTRNRRPRAELTILAED